ncbi:MAG TPA: aldo/keto reductase [Spirochaetia bacterium]|nr:aldo/keto reductase [Spirochaetia bacterium]
MSYTPRDDRYVSMKYVRCGRSGLKLPLVSLGLWHNFGGEGASSALENGRLMVRRAFDLGITHFDLANNYGPPPGSAELHFGKILADDFRSHRDEMVISSKAGYLMWPGPYGEWGSKKYLVASLDQSLERMGLDYVDIFYSHRPDPETPLEETMGALDRVVRQGKALYAGISNYKPAEARQAIQILRRLGTPCLIHQPSYSMLNRWVEDELLDLLAAEGVGCIAFSPLARGQLTDRYLQGIPSDSRAASGSVALKPEQITDQLREKVRRLERVARKRGESIARMALAWVLRTGKVTSVLVGASKVSQVEDCARVTASAPFSGEELAEIEAALAG